VDGCLRVVPFGEPREGVHLQGTVRDSGRRAPEMEHLYFTGALIWETWGVKEGSGNGYLFQWGPHWETWESV
jgi:hypothetical protein